MSDEYNFNNSFEEKPKREEPSDFNAPEHHEGDFHMGRIEFDHVPPQPPEPPGAFEIDDEEVQRFLSALKAFSKSVERALHVRDYQSTGMSDMVMQGYVRLRDKAKEMFPDDFYITDVIAVEINQDQDERGRLTQVQFVITQLYEYIYNQARNDLRKKKQVEFRVERSSGRDLADEILNVTRNALKRAVSGIDIDFSIGDSPSESLTGLNLEGEDLTGRNFSDSKLTGVNMQGATLHDAKFTDSKLQGVNMQGINGANIKFTDSKMVGVNLSNSQLSNAKFVDASMKQTNLANCTLDNANFTDANCEAVNFSGSSLENAVFIDANLLGANLADTTLQHSDFTDANLEGANLASSNIYAGKFTDAQMVGTNLAGCTLENADFIDATLRGANFRDANINNADFTDADLAGVTLPDGTRYTSHSDLSRFGAKRKI